MAWGTAAQAEVAGGPGGQPDNGRGRKMPMDTARPAPLTIAHRGFSARCPENTLVSFEAALAEAIDGCECDVHLSADGVAYLLHDHSLRRTTGRDVPAEALRYAEIAALDAGSWKGPEFAGERVPTLSDALRAHLGRGVLVIELKGGSDHDLLARTVLSVIAECGAQGHCCVIAFDLDQVAAVARLEPRVPCLWLLSSVPAGEAERRELCLRALSAGQRGLSVHHAALDAQFVRLAHSLALTVWTWTINDQSALQHALNCGVDGVCGDDPAWLHASLPGPG